MGDYLDKSYYKFEHIPVVVLISVESQKEQDARMHGERKQ